MPDPATTPPVDPPGGTPPADPPADPPGSPTEFDWRQVLTTENANDPSLADFKDVNALADAFRNTKQLVGKSIRPPGPDASAEEHAAFRQDLLDRGLGLAPIPDTVEGRMELYKQMGLPEEASGYDPIEGLEPERFGQIAALAHQAGVSKEQFNAVLGELVKADASTIQEQTATREAGIEQLKGEWGDAYQQKFERAKQAAQLTKAPAQLLAQLDGNQVGAETLRWLDGLASAIGTEGQQLANDLGAVTTDTREEVQSQFDEITRRLINDKDLPPAEYQRLNQKRLKLMERLQS